jgi:hypothetical protein
LPKASTQKLPKRSGKKYWSGEVTQHSNALDLEEGVFTWNDPKRIAQSLKKSAETSSRRKSSPRQSAMSMLNFYLNRAGKNLGAQQRKTLNQAKKELSALYEQE